MRKVIIGCKGDSGLKFELTREAARLGLSLSEYMESILENRHSNEDSAVLRQQLKEHQNKLENVKSELECYEMQLEELFKEHKGKELQLRLSSGKMESLIINDKVDLLEVLIASVKH